jgi:chromosome segregation ATPase
MSGHCPDCGGHIGQLTATKCGACTERDALKEKVKELEEANDYHERNENDLCKLIADLRAKLDRAEREIASLSRVCNSDGAAKVRLLREREDLLKRIAEVERQRDELAEAQGTLNEPYLKAATQRADAEAECAALRTQVQTYTKALETIRAYCDGTNRSTQVFMAWRTADDALKGVSRE